MATKETSKQTLEAAEVNGQLKQESANFEVGSKQNQTEEKSLEQLQKEAVNSLNTLWDALRKNGFKVFNTLQLFGTAFDVEKNEDGDQQYFKPHNLADIDTEGRGREAKEESPFIAQPAQQESTFRNVMNNSGRTRSINTKANNHHGRVL